MLIVLYTIVCSKKSIVKSCKEIIAQNKTQNAILTEKLNKL